MESKTIESAKDCLQRLYDLKGDYAKTKNHLDKIELDMAKCFDTVAYVLRAYGNEISEKQKENK